MMKPTPVDAKAYLDELIAKSRVDLYKPVQVAEVLNRRRLDSGATNPHDTESYRLASRRWRDEVTVRLTGKRSTSSARYQDDLWNANAMPANILTVLCSENDRTNGGVEAYIYFRYEQRQATVTEMVAYAASSAASTFQLPVLLGMFDGQEAISKSVDKAFEVVTYSLIETVVTALATVVRVEVPVEQRGLLVEFDDLARVFLGVTPDAMAWEQPARLYRGGVTNAADGGIDMWANYGPAVQVKHITLNAAQANRIANQVDGDCVVIVCRDTHANAIQAVVDQIGWGTRVRGIIQQSHLEAWYEKCLRGRFAARLAVPLLSRLSEGIRAEFPQVDRIREFMDERGYVATALSGLWSLG